jgi:hypothetical protein
MESISDRIITAPVGEFCRLSGLGRTRVYELIGAGELDSITIGKRRLVVIESYRKLIERQRAAAPPPRTKGKARIAAQP